MKLIKKSKIKDRVWNSQTEYWKANQKRTDQFYNEEISDYVVGLVVSRHLRRKLHVHRNTTGNNGMNLREVGIFP